MKRSKTLWITTTAMLIALMLIIQLLSKVIGAQQLVTGSLVNFILVIGAAVFGFSSAGVVAVLSALLAFFFGMTPGANPAMVPVIMLGNLLIVIITGFGFKQSTKLHGLGKLCTQTGGVIIGAGAKFAVMWVLTTFIVIPYFITKAPVAKLVGVAMSYPQLITSLVGGIVAILIAPALKRAIKSNRQQM
jgi:hypothetical protein